MKNPFTGRGKHVVILLCFLLVLLLISYYFISRSVEKKNANTMVMGGKYYDMVHIENTEEINEESLDRAGGSAEEKEQDLEEYFRPSSLPVLNTRFDWNFIDDYYDKKPSDIKLPSDLFRTPEDTILNYFSILREAANIEKGKSAGCGTLGNAGIPYPIAYNFLDDEYKDRLSYKEYRKTFENILHINLIKYHSVPVYDTKENIQRYFVELETIEGNEKNQGSFAYYYGFVDLKEEKGEYKISNMEFHGENYLCAPYHGWAYDAEMSVKVRYGEWCELIEKMYPVKQEGYIKNISFKGNDGSDYLLVYYQLTNDTDIEIAQYRKAGGGEWEQIRINPEDCVKDENGTAK